MRYGIWRPLPQYASGVRKWDYGRAVKPRCVFVHIMEGHLAGTDGWFRNPASGTTSTHFGIGHASWYDRLIRRVSVYQWVDTNNTAYGTAVTRYPVSPLAKAVLGDLIGRIDINHAIIHIEVEGYPYQAWPSGFVSALNGLLGALAYHGPLYVLRHNDVSSKVCPGAAPWGSINPTYGARLGTTAIPNPMEGFPLKFRQNSRKVTLQPGVNVRRAPSTTADIHYTTKRVQTHTTLGMTLGSSINGKRGWWTWWSPETDTADTWDGRLVYVHEDYAS